MMRTARIKAEAGGYYHCMSRVIERRMAFGRYEKETFRTLMRKVEEFSGIRILTYTILENHFHILAHVPEREDLSDKELVRRLRVLYPKVFVDEYERSLAEARKEKDEKYHKHLREQYLYRMYEVSEFMKTLKQRFTMWYNKRIPIVPEVAVYAWRAYDEEGGFFGERRGQGAGRRGAAAGGVGFALPGTVFYGWGGIGEPGVCGGGVQEAPGRVWPQAQDRRARDEMGRLGGAVYDAGPA